MSKTASMLVMVGLVVLGLGTAAAQQPDGPDLPTVVKGQPASAMRGIWQSRGYGYLVSVDRGAPKMFHVADEFCYADPSKPNLDNLLGFYRPWGKGSIAFSNELGETQYIFDKLGEPASFLHGDPSVAAVAHRRPGRRNLRQLLPFV